MEEEQASNNLVVLMLYSTNSIKITEIHRHGDMFYSSCDIRSIGLNLTLLKGGMYLDEKEIYEICMSVDSFIADRLTESIVRGTSYDMLEAHYGILPISRRGIMLSVCAESVIIQIKTFTYIGIEQI